MARISIMWGYCLLAVLAFISSDSTAKDIVTIPAASLPAAGADVEIQFARGDVPTAKAGELCPKLKDKQSLVNFGCEKAATLEAAKKVWEKNEESSAWQALSMIDPAKHGADKASALVNQIMEDALGSVKIESGQIKFGKTNQADTTGRLIFACGQLANCLEQTLTSEERVAVARYLLSVTPVTGPVALGLKALSDFGMASVTHKQQDKAATVVVSSLVGKPLSWKLGKATASVVSAVAGKSNEIKVQFDNKGVSPKVPVEVELVNGGKTTFYLEFEVNAEFKDAKIVIREKSTIKKEQPIGNHPAKLSSSLSLEPNHVMELTLTSTSGNAAFCPEQAVLAFISGSNEYQVPASCAEKEIRVSVSNSQKLAEELKFQSGSYDLVFIASDDKMSNPTAWKLASVHLALSPLPEKKHEALFTHSLLHESDTTLRALPEIHHQFRHPDRRAPMVLSLVFTCGQCGLLFALFLGLVSQGFNPLNILKSVRLMFFSGVLTGIEAILFWYWLGPAGAPNMESLAYKYLPPLTVLLYVASKNVFASGSKRKAASM